MKFLASDFDGTLYFGKKIGIHESDITAILKFQKAGHKFGICSGRPFLGMRNFLINEETGSVLEPDFYIQNSGAHILDKYGNTLYEKEIDHETVRVICTCNPGFVTIFYGEKNIYINVQMGNDFFKSIYDLLQNPKEKIYGFSVQFKDEDMAKTFVDELKRMKELDVYQNRNSIDCVAKGCSKESGIKFIEQIYDTNIIACIGDSYNDIPMLEGTTDSFTFHNSPQEVKDKAAHVVNSIAECIDILMNQ